MCGNGEGERCYHRLRFFGAGNCICSAQNGLISIAWLHRITIRPSDSRHRSLRLSLCVYECGGVSDSDWSAIAFVSLACSLTGDAVSVVGAGGDVGLIFNFIPFRPAATVSVFTIYRMEVSFHSYVPMHFMYSNFFLPPLSSSVSGRIRRNTQFLIFLCAFYFGVDVFHRALFRVPSTACRNDTPLFWELPTPEALLVVFFRWFFLQPVVVTLMRLCALNLTILSSSLVHRKIAVWIIIT